MYRRGRGIVSVQPVVIMVRGVPVHGQGPLGVSRQAQVGLDVVYQAVLGGLLLVTKPPAGVPVGLLGHVLHGRPARQRRVRRMPLQAWRRRVDRRGGEGRRRGRIRSRGSVDEGIRIGRRVVGADGDLRVGRVWYLGGRGRARRRAPAVGRV